MIDTLPNSDKVKRMLRNSIFMRNVLLIKPELIIHVGADKGSWVYLFWIKYSDQVFDKIMRIRHFMQKNTFQRGTIFAKSAGNKLLQFFSIQLNPLVSI